MKKETLHIEYELFDHPDELPEDERILLERAAAATATAYAPFSGFFVGCAVQLADGEIVTGSNQENRAFPSGLCAERTALFAIGAAGKGDQVRKLAVSAKSDKIKVEIPPTPCGGCRQVMLEYEYLAGTPLVVLMRGETGEILRVKGVMDQFLPFGFKIDF